LHTAYTIEAVKGKPAWLPLAVYDDGNKTVIRFKEPLTYTQAPAPFATNTDGTPSLVQFMTYKVPGEPDKGEYMIVQGLYPQLELKGGDGQVIKITRQTGQPKPYKEVSDAR
jgi:type IV secretory pathway VirB9-like protein